MSSYSWLTSRRRRQNLFIVEGNHEKDELIGLLLKTYPEIDIDMENILIYGTNIYMLYNDIVKEYESDWDKHDVDLAFIVSRKKGYEEPWNKVDFNNIILIFDYERHDPNFSEENITRMQSYFNDSTDVGKLYINYPMIESYQHLYTIPDDEYENRTIPVTLQRGCEYKNQVRDTKITKLVNFPDKMKSILEERFNLDQNNLKECTERILSICSNQDLIKEIESILTDYIEKDAIKTTVYQFNAMIVNAGYANDEKTYYQYMRNTFNEIIKHNICKANKIDGNNYKVDDDILKDTFFELNLQDVLLKQNDLSRDNITGKIWVLNTGLFFITDYNFNLII